ncbi:MAG: molybdopterin molybdotransferase MoeA [Caldilineales bacterium]|nr:molybdopterin molybdotransferase MoeA [Caldilineales bacterium]MDW8317271.1 molybdopterin molybdotransferase MoeA [Anaerolineae bacterium]
MRESPYPLVSVDDAQATVLRWACPLPVQEVPLRSAQGLVLARDVVAPLSLPPFPAAAMDGFALLAADGHAPRRLIGEQMAGRVAGLTVTPGAAVRITTGAPVPPGADAVVKVEAADEVDGTVVVHPDHPVRPGLNVRPVGSDVAQGQPVLAAGQVLGPAELGVLASLGLSTVPVHRQPVVGIFSTGDELAEPGQPLGPGQIYDSNRTTLVAAVAQAGGQPLDLGIIRDDPAELERRLAAGLVEADLLVTSGGVSMGELDLLKPLLERWGTVHFGRVLMKPGKPMTFATLRARRPDGQPASEGPWRLFFALPGNPVSALVTFQLFVRPAIRRMMGHRAVGLPQIVATLGHPFRLDPERPEFHRVTLHREGSRCVAVSTGSQASSRLLSAAGANGLLVLEKGRGELPAGVERPVLLLDDTWLSAAA